MRIVYVSPIQRGNTIADYTSRLVHFLSEQADILIIGEKTEDVHAFPDGNVLAILSRRDPSSFFAAVKVIVSYRPDIVHIQDTVYSYVPWLPFFLKTLGSYRVVLTAHEVHMDRQDGRLIRIYAKPRLIEPLIRLAYLKYNISVYSMVKKLIVHNGVLAQRLVRIYGISPRKILVIPYGADLTLIPKTDYEIQNRIAFFGYLTPHKGIELLIDAFEELYENYPFLELILIGDLPTGPFKRSEWYRKLLKRIRNSHVGNRIRMMGHLEGHKLYDQLRSSDAVVLPYDNVSHSSACLLAMTLGCSVIATRVGGFRDQIVERKTGILVPKSSKALGEAIEILLKDYGLRKEIGQQARRHVEKNLAWSKTAEQHIRLYKNLLA